MLTSVQLLLWTASGVYFAWIHIDNIRGKNETNKINTSLNLETPVDLERIFKQADINPIRQIVLKTIAGQPYFIVQGEKSEHRVRFKAADGALASPIAQSEAEFIARQDFNGDEDIAAVQWLEQDAPVEYHRQLPVYRIQFDNAKHTTLYIDAFTGEITARRNQLWRIYDWLWMMHIMDYDERTDFNNILIKGFSLLGLSTALSGLVFFILLQRRQVLNRKARR